MNCKDCKAIYMGETKRTLNIRAEEHITAIKSANKKSHTAECCRKYNMTLTANIRKYWTLRKIGRQVPSRSQSTQKKTRIISMEYLETDIMRKQSKENNHQNYNIKLSLQRSSNEYGSVQVCTQNQPIKNDLRIFRSSANT